MSDPVVASYAFLPWLRRGVAREIARTDGTMNGDPRASVPITLQLDAEGQARPVVTQVSLFGPGEVAALDPRAVIRTIPRPDETDAEPSYFAAIEFDQPELPWRFTPARAGARSRLHPWLVLAVLRADEIESETPGLGDGTLPAVVVARADALPRLDQSWAWAHVQVDGLDSATESLDAVVSATPQRVRARLLAPRRLLPRTPYRAVVVPAFERGRRAGLREDMDETVDGLAPAWVAGAQHVRLPVYFGWSFQTGEAGDFETLARRLTAREVGEGIGVRDMDVSAPDPALPAAASRPLAMEGALMSPQAASTPWDAAERGAFTAALAPVLNAPADALEDPAAPRTVAPPLWARWQAAQDRFDPAPDAPPRWLQELNADPRLRASAGLGAEVIRRNDQQLMAEAWKQVEGILEANAGLRRAQLSREASDRLLRRHLAPLATDAFISVSAPLHPRFALSPDTAWEVLRRSPIPAGALGGVLRRVLRPAGPIGRRLARLRAPAAAALLERLDRGEVRPRPPDVTPADMVTPGRLRAALEAAGLLPTAGAQRRFWLLALLLALLGLIALLRSVPAAIALLAAAAGAALLALRARRAEAADVHRMSVLDGTATPADVAAVPTPPGWMPMAAVPGGWSGAPAAPPTDPALAAGAVSRFRAAFGDLVGEIDKPSAPGPRLVVADLRKITAALIERMDPRLTIPAGIASRLTVAGWVTWQYAAQDPIEPILAAPRIDTPMYEPLKELGQSWLLPGVETIPADTVTLVVTNPRFIEAYMAGLSHEMSRELLYHEYPTDQRGTYFRQFWDVRGVVSPTGGAPDPETLRDIVPIHTWLPETTLGIHSGRTPALRNGHLVLLVKGQLLRRFPHTLVYAVQAVPDGRGGNTLGEVRKFPAFEGRLEPDISFFGFDLLPDEARGQPGQGGDPGWFFVLQEQPTEPVFGLDPGDPPFGARPGSWDDLAWTQLAADQASFDALRYIDLDAQLPDTTAVVADAGAPPLAWHAEAGLGAAGSNSSDLAYLTLQRPFRVAIHGADMLPPGGAP